MRDGLVDPNDKVEDSFKVGISQGQKKQSWEWEDMRTHLIELTLSHKYCHKQQCLDPGNLSHVDFQVSTMVMTTALEGDEQSEVFLLSINIV